jgi:hypothetical protein
MTCLMTHFSFVVYFFFAVISLSSLQTFSCSRFRPDCQVNAKSCGKRQPEAASKCPQHLTPTEDLWPAEWLDPVKEPESRELLFASLKRRDVDIIYLELAGT